METGLGKSSRKGQYISLDDKHTVRWITSKPLSDQEQATKYLLQELLQAACQPWQRSGNACVKLCYFVEQCLESSSSVVRNVAFSYSTCLNLFSFYVKWNEKNQHRSMKQVLDLLVTMISHNPEKLVGKEIKCELLYQLISNITHESAQAFVKPTFKVLECFLSKAVISVTELLEAHASSTFFKTSSSSQTQNVTHMTARDSFVSAVFDWMSLPETAPGAGKLLVTFFLTIREHRLTRVSDDSSVGTALWQRWIRFGLIKHPECLENVKNYLFPPLFKIDRDSSLDFLRCLAQEVDFQYHENQDLDIRAFLFLSAMEAGKKSGLVDESSISLQKSSVKARNVILLPEDVIGALLSHSLSRVRSAAFSVLVSSVSLIRPFSTYTLDLLKQNLCILHADTDAKFRNEILSISKNMVERLRGATSGLKRELAMSALSVHRDIKLERDISRPTGEANCELEISLQEHKDFMIWYLRFLSDEIIPTTSYQRHITALRVIQTIIKSGAPRSRALTGSIAPQDAQSAWTFDIFIFTKKMSRLLLDCLMDPFEDVRAAATDVLKFVFSDSRQNEKLHYSTGYPSYHLSNLRIMEAKSKGVENISFFSHKERGEEDGAEEMWYGMVPTLLLKFIDRALRASQRTGRADIADGVARSSELLCVFLVSDQARLAFLESLILDLERSVAVAEDDIAKAVSLAPIHGQFASLRLAWDFLSQPLSEADLSGSETKGPGETSLNLLSGNTAWKKIQYRMIRCCARIWSAVQEVLCNDSPEGHLPVDIDEYDTLDTKDILSYSFRATHESSNLLALMVSKVKLKFTDGSPLLPFDAFQEAGDLTFRQLASLRHRGAFSTVSLTFAKCCQLSQDPCFENPDRVTLLQTWYQGTLVCIQKQASTTRRSAGIPALMTGVLSANSTSLAFESVMSDLKVLAQQSVLLSDKDETYLPQVHALNCLKEIFKSSILGKRSESHIPDCLQLAATSLKSNIWAIRNCGLLLLRSLIDCLFGTSESKSVTESGWDGRSTRLAYESYPALSQLLLELMTPSIDEQTNHRSSNIGAVESVFPALDIIRRAGPPSALRREIFSGIRAHLGSKMWHIRDIAARTMCTILLHDRWFPVIIELLNTCGESSNEVHGILMTTKYLLARMFELNPASVSEKLSALADQIKDFWYTKACFQTMTFSEAAYEDLAGNLLKVVHLNLVIYRETPGNPRFPEANIVLYDEDIFHGASKKLIEGSMSMPNDEINDARYITGAKMSFALLVKAMAVRAIYTSAISGQIVRLKELVKVAVEYDPDMACEILDQMSLVWDKRDSLEVLVALIDIYRMVLLTSSVSHTRSSALRNLNTVFDILSERDALWTAVSAHNLHLLDISPLCGSPDLSNAEIRITGSLLLLHIRSQGHTEDPRNFFEQIEAWGCMVSAVGKAENDFDSRFAAVEALSSFWQGYCKNSMALSKNESFLPSLLALYDTLNDDDDEIREAGSATVSTIVGASLVPLAASGKFLRWIAEEFNGTDAFGRTILQRTTGFNNISADILHPVGERLAKAMEDDDSLFIEEEQNLYVDEVREIIAWTSLLSDSDEPHWNEIAIQLSSWALEGLNTLSRLAETEDGPYGWTSKPKVFEICIRIILTARALLARHFNVSSSAERAQIEAGDNDLISQHREDNVAQLVRLAIVNLHDIGSRNDLHPVLLDYLEHSNTLSAVSSKSQNCTSHYSKPS